MTEHTPTISQAELRSLLELTQHRKRPAAHAGQHGQYLGQVGRRALD